MPTLGYWNIRGLGQSIRLLLAFTGTDFNENLYNFGEAPNFNRSEWLEVKNSLGFNFPNLPYYIDKNIKITESNAIARYIGRKNGLDGKSQEEKVFVDMIENISYNLHNEFADLCYKPILEEKHQNFLFLLKEKLKNISKFLGNKKFIISNEVTFVDFHMYEILDILKIFSPETFNQFPNLIEYLINIENLPSIKSYMKSPKFIKTPIFAKNAYWGNY